MSSRHHEATKDGVGEAWAWWLQQHDISVPECIQAAIKEAFADWLDENRDAVLAALAAKNDGVAA